MISLVRLAVLTFLAAYAGEFYPAEERFQLVGRILADDGKPFRGVIPSVFLYGATTPFATHTQADAGGKFTIKNLAPGNYTIIITVPRAGETTQSVVIGPSQADSKGRISITFPMDRQSRAMPRVSVSVSQLSVPDKAREEYRKAQQRLERWDVEGAVAHLKRAVEIFPQHSHAWNSLGTIAYQSGDFRKAEDCFRRALEADPQSYPPLVNLGGALLSQGEFHESLRVNLEAAQTRPDDALAHCQLGMNYLALKEFEKAETHLKMGKALDPQHFSFPQLSLADVYLQQRNLEAAMRELEEFLKLHPDSNLAPAMREKLAVLRAFIPR